MASLLTSLVTDSLAALAADPEKTAKVAKLRYVSDNDPGISRRRRGKGFSYYYPDGEPVSDKDKARIESLIIPPAWADVWICRQTNGHLQATGQDERGRKQYRYHPRWHEVRDEIKFHRMIRFGEILPTLRERVTRDMGLRGLPKEKVVAAVVKLLETTLIRVGNDEYAQKNGSYGLTTMRRKHVGISGAEIHFNFVGKSGKAHEICIRDKELAQIVKKCHELPGYEIFKYVDDDGEWQDLNSSHVNDYLHEATGEDITAKDFRTWAGTVMAASELCVYESCESETEAKKHIAEAIKRVAQKLGNTPAVCRKSYVHPEVLGRYLKRDFRDNYLACMAEAATNAPEGLEPEEAATLTFLRRCLD